MKCVGIIPFECQVAVNFQLMENGKIVSFDKQKLMIPLVLFQALSIEEKNPKENFSRNELLKEDLGVEHFQNSIKQENADLLIDLSPEKISP